MLSLFEAVISGQTNTLAKAKLGSVAPAPTALQEASAAKASPPSPPLIIDVPKDSIKGPVLAMAALSTNAVTEPLAAISIPSTNELETVLGTNGVNEADEVMPLCVFDEAPLHEAIKTLTRWSRINFLFDPKLTTAVGPDGRPVPQPLVSLRLENVTARQVLDAVLKSYNYVLVPDSRSQISMIRMKDPAALEPLTNAVVQLSYSSPTNLVSTIKMLFSPPSRCQVIPDVRTSQLVLMATEKEMEDILALIKKLDTPTKQVLIEARLLETSQNPQSVKGIDWSGTLENQRVSFGNGLTGGSSTTLTPGGSASATLPSGRTVGGLDTSATVTTSTTTFGSGGTAGSGSGNLGPGGISLNTARGFAPNVAFLNADGVSAALSFLNKDNDTEVVATPRAVTLDNETATLSVTRAFPIFNITPGSANVAAGANIQYTNLGTTLLVTPRISGTNDVALRVSPEVSNIDGKDQQTINGQLNVANVYAIRKIETHVVIPSGHTLVMGGLISDTSTKAYTKVPILGDMPLIGLAFRKDSKSRTKQNLLIFLTPTIIRDDDFQTLPTSSFLRNKPKDSTNYKETAWNSGKPHKWSKSSKSED